MKRVKLAKEYSYSKEKSTIDLWEEGINGSHICYFKIDLLLSIIYAVLKNDKKIREETKGLIKHFEGD